MMKPGMYETPGLACRTLGCYMVLGTGVWIAAFAIAFTVARRLLAGA